jgi:hypothetical protein
MRSSARRALVVSGWTPDWRLKQERIDWWYHNMTSVLQPGIAEITNQLEYDDEVVFQARRKLFDYARSAGLLFTSETQSVAEEKLKQLQQELDLLQAAYKAAVENWVTDAELDKWEAAHFHEHKLHWARVRYDDEERVFKANGHPVR